ncbi:helix-turn-helix domain-containing protein [Nocardioides sp. B-3]|uniref:helix-turn-helix domain-containing protein n=1 Tax=Nocardioides sp. B-3 TaxID=2895565 RepID=UPI002152D3DD|nr:helix-turn-helix transcriptional regulator [Nocardioides sp. B-3]UUZ59350.1 helix-turn-helix domain-containing protein [Nocardioides sp. B-3]
MATMTTEADLQQDHVGSLVRRWRERRRLSQQALSDRCGVSTRHLSYIETGKSVPSPTMISQLGDALEVPLRGAATDVHRGGLRPERLRPAARLPQARAGQ